MRLLQCSDEGKRTLMERSRQLFVSYELNWTGQCETKHTIWSGVALECCQLVGCE